LGTLPGLGVDVGELLLRVFLDPVERLQWCLGEAALEEEPPTRVDVLLDEEESLLRAALPFNLSLELEPVSLLLLFELPDPLFFQLLPSLVPLFDLLLQSRDLPLLFVSVFL